MTASSPVEVYDGTVHLWGSRNWQTPTHPHTGIRGRRSIVYHSVRTGNILASGSVDSTVQLWKVSTGSLLRTFTGHARSVNSVSFSPDGNILASRECGSAPSQLWKVSTNNPVHNAHRAYGFGQERIVQSRMGKHLPVGVGITTTSVYMGSRNWQTPPHPHRA